MNLDRLIGLKENFTGQTFQWIKTNDPSLRGKIVKCKDIIQKGNKFIAHFNDGSQINTNLLNRNLMMIGEGMQTLSKGEIESINGPIGAPLEIPPELKEPSISPGIGKVAQTVPLIAPPIAPSSSNDMFSMFNADDTDLPLNVRVKLPNKKLLKLMYENADDKKKFLMDLSQYVYSKINKNIVNDSLQKMMAPPPKRSAASMVSKIRKQDDETVIKVTELKNGE